MGSSLRQLFRDPFVFRLWIVLCALSLAYATLGFLKWNDLPPQVPLFYSLPRGEEQLAIPMVLFLLPGLSVAIFLIHTISAALLYTNHKLAAQLLFANCSIAWIVLFITFVNILFLVT